MVGTGDSTDDFDLRYAVVGSPIMREVERRIIGCEYGATSYTTKAQADGLTRALGLEPGRSLLDIGSGAGWPGIYLARTTGCRVVLTDLSLEGMHTASRRMAGEGVDGAVLATSGSALPLRDTIFDAVTSSDVLCWLADELSVLRACHRVLAPGGRMASLVIAVASGLSAEQVRRAQEAGPTHLTRGERYPSQLRAAGFEDVEVVDVTSEYIVTLGAWVREWDRAASDLRGLLGSTEFAERQTRRRRALDAARDGILTRYLLAATRP